MRTFAAVTLAGLAVATTASETSNPRPIIGIFGQPSTNSMCPAGTINKSCQYIAASYVKFVESHGGRAVPIPYYADNATIDHLFGSINGVLFPGGGATMPPAATRMYENAVAANRAGDHFPLWGTCMGFQWLVMLAGGALDGGYDSENVTLALDYTAAAPGSKLLSGLDATLYDELADPDHTTAFNNHMYGITPAHFAATPSLAATFTVLSTSKDRNGLEFVSTMEATGAGLPFYGVQWHPEKNAWEFNENPDGSPFEAIPHSPNAVAVALYLADFLVTESRKSGHRFADPLDEQSSIIWNYPVFNSAQTKSTSFVQEYIYNF